MIEQRYRERFFPLVQEFIQEVEGLPHPPGITVPEPFLPLVGKSYETAALRLVIMGQDTRGWGDLQHFMAAEKEKPGTKIDERHQEFYNHEFTQYGPRPQQFLGFVMMLLAALHDSEDWALMKQGKMRGILNSFAWANGNAVELYGSSVSKKGVARDYWEAVRRGGKRFDRFEHLEQVLKPHVVLVLYRGLDLKGYFDGYKPVKVDSGNQFKRFIHYREEKTGVDIFHAPHPGSMNRIEGVAYYKDLITSMFRSQNHTVPFPEFVNVKEEGRQVLDYLKDRSKDPAPDFDKYAFISWVTEHLRNREAFMSVPALSGLLNEKGFTRNDGSAYQGARGSYHLIRTAYDRLVRAGQQEHANEVARSFRRPDFAYAYSTE